MRIASPDLRVLVPSWRLPQLPRFRVLRARPASEWALFGTILLYVAIGVFVYFWLVEPWISGQIDVRIGADSDKLWDAVEQMQGFSLLNSGISLASNLLIPIVLGTLLKNGFAVMCFNVFLFCVSLKIAFSIPGVKKSLFGFLMILNAELFPSLTTLNKEILALFAAVLTAKYIYSKRRSNLLFLAVCVASFCARWEMLAIFLVYFFLHRSKRPKLAIAAFIAAITVAYPLAVNAVGIDLSALTSQGENGNTITFLNGLQAHYGFPIVLLPKAFMSLAGRLGAPWSYLNGDFIAFGLEDVQQQIFQPVGCAAYMIVFALAYKRGKMNVRRPIAFLVAVSVIWVAATPFVQPRYLYAAYILLCLELSRVEEDGPSQSTHRLWASDLKPPAILPSPAD